MKKLSIRLPLLALVMAVAASAFTTEARNARKENQTQLHWFAYDANTSQLGAYVGLMDREDAKVTGCNQSTSIDCRRGYTSSQLVNSSNPSAGVQAGQINSEQDRLRKQ